MNNTDHLSFCPQRRPWSDHKACICKPDNLDGPGSMTVVVTFAGDEKQTFNNVLVPTQGEPFHYHDNGTRVQFESADTRDPILYTVLNPLSIATFAE